MKCEDAVTEVRDQRVHKILHQLLSVLSTINGKYNSVLNMDVRTARHRGRENLHRKLGNALVQGILRVV